MTLARRIDQQQTQIPPLLSPIASYYGDNAIGATLFILALVMTQ
jgi:hypothetical protein